VAGCKTTEELAEIIKGIATSERISRKSKMVGCYYQTSSFEKTLDNPACRSVL